VVVTGPRRRELRGGPHRPQGRRATDFADDGREILDDLGSFGTGQADIAMSALAVFAEKSRSDQQRQVVAGGGGDHAGVTGKLPCGPGTSV
jgi:hypothetical protein